MGVTLGSEEFIVFSCNYFLKKRQERGNELGEKAMAGRFFV